MTSGYTSNTTMTVDGEALKQSLELIKIFSPKKAILTNLHSEFDYKILKNKLPKNIVPAYDGLKLYF